MFVNEDYCESHIQRDVLSEAPPTFIQQTGRLHNFVPDVKSF